MAKHNIHTRRVCAWMTLHGLTQQEVASAAGVSQAMVSYFLRGQRNSPRLRDYFLSRGCPEKFLGEQRKEAA